MQIFKKVELMKTKIMIMKPVDYLKNIDDWYKDDKVSNFRLLSPIQQSRDIFNYDFLKVEINYK